MCRSPTSRGAPVYSSLMRTVDDLASLAAGSVVELPPRGAEFLPASLAHVERQLFAGDPVVAPLDGSIRWLEGAGSRGTLELVAEGALAEIRAGTPPHEIAVVCPSVEAVRLALGTAFASLGVPVSFESRAALATTPFGYALLSLLRFAWVGGDRRGLFASLRSPYSGLARKEVDWIEGRLRGRGIVRGDRAAEVATELREGRSLPPLDIALRDSSPVAVARELAATMLRSAHGTSEPPTGERSPPRSPRVRRGVSRARRARHAHGLGRGDARRGARRARSSLRARRARRGTRPRRGARPRQGPHAPLRRRLHRRSGAGIAPTPTAGRAVPRRGDEAGPRRESRRPARATRLRQPGSLSVRHRVREAAAAARARAPGGRRRGLPARGGALLGCGAGPVPRGRRPPAHVPPSAFGAHVRHRDGADRARAAPGAGRPGRDAARRRLRARTRERVGSPARARDACVRPTDRRDPRACAPPAGAGFVLGLGARAHGLAAPPRGSSSDTCARRRSTRRSTGCCAARSSMQRCSASTSGCRARCREPTV